jgi:hypothetical protein
MVFAEGPQERARSYPLCPPAAVDSSLLGAGETAAAGTDAEPEPLTGSVAPPLPGNFVSAQYESDCARFVSEAKRLARRRVEALGRPSAAF